ncbi:MAG: YegP family protein [Chloroflexi bacterium]|nr:YegP family protein [Chloroflexota bacterium]
MVTTTSSNNVHLGENQLLRPRFFQRQAVTARDLTAGQDYLHERLRRHNRFLHGCGVVCGLEVFLEPLSDAVPSVSITAGYALSPYGDEIYLPEPKVLVLDCIEDISGDCYQIEPSSSGQRIYVAARFKEEEAKPVAPIPERCNFVLPCENSRYRAGIEIKCFDHLPPSCPPSPVNCDFVLEDLVQARSTAPLNADDVHGMFACPPSPEGPWVVLAGIDVDTEGGIAVDYDPRRFILSTHIMTEMLRCLFSTAPTRFQLYLDRADEFRWRLLVGFNEIIADSGEGFVTRDECNNELLRVRAEAAGAAIEDITAAGVDADPTRNDNRFQVYVDRAGEYRWRFLFGERQIVCDSGEGYETRRELDRDLRRVQTLAASTFIEDLAGHFPRTL